MKGDFVDIAEDRQQPGENPRVQRRMRVPAHVDEFALKDVLRVARMRGIDQRVLRSEEVVRIVALDRLRQETAAGAAERSRVIERAILPGFHRTTGLRAAPHFIHAAGARQVRRLQHHAADLPRSPSAIEIIASMNRSSSRLLSVSVGSIISAPWHDQREADGVGMEAVVDQPLGDVAGAHALLRLPRSR